LEVTVWMPQAPHPSFSVLKARAGAGGSATGSKVAEGRCRRRRELHLVPTTTVSASCHSQAKALS
jgi:hypothetical protein